MLIPVSKDECYKERKRNMLSRQKVKNVIVTLLVLCSMLSFPAAAKGYSNYHMHLEAGQKWTDSLWDERTGAYNDIIVRCDAVYPAVGFDNFTQIQCQATDAWDNVVTDIVTLTEGASSSYIPLKNGTLNTPYIGFQFRGNNTNLAAEAIISCEAR